MIGFNINGEHWHPSLPWSAIYRVASQLKRSFVDSIAGYIGPLHWPCQYQDHTTTSLLRQDHHLNNLTCPLIFCSSHSEFWCPVAWNVLHVKFSAIIFLIFKSIAYHICNSAVALSDPESCCYLKGTSSTFWGTLLALLIWLSELLTLLVTVTGWTWLFMARLSSTDFMGLPSVSLIISSISASVLFFLALAWACCAMILMRSVCSRARTLTEVMGRPEAGPRPPPHQ